MVRRKRLEACRKVADLGCCVAEAETPTVVLKHIDPRPAIGCINHHIEDAIWLEHVMQGPQARIRVWQVMQYAGADHMVEALTEFGGPLHRELAHLEVCERILAL